MYTIYIIPTVSVHSILEKGRLPKNPCYMGRLGASKSLNSISMYGTR